MTYREWMKENRPEKISDAFIGGVIGCPGEYFTDAPLRGRTSCLLQPMNCQNCWDREIPKGITPFERYLGEFEQDETENTDCRGTDAPRNDEPKDDSVKDDPVNHPSHYCAGGVECIDAISAALCKYTDPVDAWLAGQVIKYLWRSPLKGAYEQDLKKAQFYMNRLVKRQEGKK